MLTAVTTALFLALTVATATAGAESLSSGAYHACAINVGGGLQCWGNNYSGQLGDGTDNDSLAPVTVVGLGAGATAVSAGGSHTCAIVSGAVKCWGKNDLGQLGNGSGDPYSYTPVQVNGLTGDVSAISVGDAHTCVIQNGAVKCWGSNTYGELGNGLPGSVNTPSAIASLSNGVTSISAGTGHTCAVQNGATLCTGPARSRRRKTAAGERRMRAW